MEEFSKPHYRVDVLKVEVPINANYVEGSSVYKGQKAYSWEEALDHFRRAASVATRPFIYLSAGVSNDQFTESLRMAAEAGTSPEDFEKLMAGTDIFTDAKRCIEFMKDPKLATTLESVKKFLNKHEKLEDTSANITFDPQFIPTK